MASSYFTESEAPRDFKVSSTESDGHYKKCLLCYTVKRNFYCADCIRAGNFVHSSMPYSDRYAEKQGKLLRIKVNRKHVLDRCERLLSPKLKRDSLLTEAKLSKDKLDLLRLAIDQRRSILAEKRKELTELKSYNNELSLKLPRYQKRVTSLGKHLQGQSVDLQNKICSYNEQAELLAALRRARIRQLTKYIFPVYLSYDTSDSIEDMEFIGDIAEEPTRRPQLHIGAPWINTDVDYSRLQTWTSAQKESAASEPSGAAGGAGGGGGEASGSGGGPHSCTAALSLGAQLVGLLAWILHVRLPYALSLSEFCNCREGRNTGAGLRARRLCACSAALCGAAGAGAAGAGGAPAAPHHALEALHALAVAANTDDPALGRVDWCTSSTTELATDPAWWEGWPEEEDNDNEPEHLHWPELEEMEEVSSSPPRGGAAGGTTAAGISSSLVTSAAASLASMWRGWTK